MASLKQITFDQGRKIEVGKTYTGNNGAVFTVENIWCDKWQHLVSYRIENPSAEDIAIWGPTVRGDTPPNSMYWWIWG